MMRSLRSVACLVIVGIALAGAACNRAAPPPVVDAGPSRSTPPSTRIYVTNEASGDLSVIDVTSQSVVATIPVGKRPRGIRVSPDKSALYVALSGSPIAGPGVDESTLPPPDRRADGIGVVDTASNKLLRILTSGHDPEQLDVTADGRRLFVSNEDAAKTTIIDIASGKTLQEVPVGDEPEGVTLRPDGKVVYVTSEADGAVFAIDAATLTVAGKAEVGHRPRSIGFLPDGSRGFVSLENDGQIAVVDAQTHKFLQLINLGGPPVRPMGIAVAPDGSAVYVSTGSYGHVFIVDPVKNQPLGSIEVGRRPWGIAVSEDGKTLYSANGPSNDVSVVDIAARRVVKKIPVGQKPWGLAIVTR
jgi:YVTN family beta-propeller protein